MREVAVLGAGAVGSVVGGELAAAGRDVLLVGRGEHVDAITDRGLELTDRSRGEQVTVDADAGTELEPARTVFLGMKTPDVQAGLAQVAATAPEATVVPLQNGVRADDLAADAVGREQVVGGVVLFGAEFLEPGRVTLTRPEPLVVGNPWGGVDEAVEQVAELLSDARRIPVQTHSRFAGARWTKLLVNLNNAVPAVTGLPLQGIYADDGLARVATGALWEGARVVRAAGRPLAPLPIVPRPLLAAIPRVPHRLGWRPVRRLMLAALGEDPVRPSTLQSVVRGGTGEIEYLNGEVVALGRRCNRTTPINEALVGLVHAVEESGAFRDRDDVVEAVRRNPTPVSA